MTLRFLIIIDTGKQKILDTGGRVARFEKRYGKKSN